MEYRLVSSFIFSMTVQTRIQQMKRPLQKARVGRVVVGNWVAGACPYVCNYPGLWAGAPEAVMMGVVVGRGEGA